MKTSSSASKRGVMWGNYYTVEEARGPASPLMAAGERTVQISSTKKLGGVMWGNSYTQTHL